LVATEGCVFPAGIAASFEVAFSSVLAAAVVRGAASADGAAVAAGAAGDTGVVSVAFVAGAVALSDGFSAAAVPFFAASLGAAFGAVGFAEASDLAAAAGGAVFVS
jgi:hypothetical protein